MNKILNEENKNFDKKLTRYLELRKKTSYSKISTVKKILSDVKNKKDLSIIHYEKKFTGIKKLNKKKLAFSKSEIKSALKRLNKRAKRDIDLAYNRILSFHKKQSLKTFSITDKLKNRLSYRTKPIDKIGVYVPGGKASYPSSVLMNCIPAIVAGVSEIYLTVPCLNKEINLAVLYAAKKCKVKKIYKIGGAQAIAAFAYGTDVIHKVDKIIGPGNEFVAMAKKEVFGEVGIDMIAGPSEVTVVADKSTS